MVYLGQQAHCVRSDRRRCAAFMLIEIMAVMAVIALLAVLALPSFVKARKQSQARRALNDVREIDFAITQWAVEKNKKDGDTIVTAEVATYLKKKWSDYDVMGQPYWFGSVGNNQVQLWWRTKDALAGVGVDWGQY